MSKYLFGYLSLISALFPILFGVVFKAYKIRRFRNIVIFVICSFITDLILLYTSKIPNYNNIFIAHIWGLIQVMLLLPLFLEIIKRYSLFIKFIGGSYITFYILNSIFNERLTVFNTMAFSVQALLMIGLSLLFFYKLYNEETTIFLDRMPEFWIVVGILMYFSGALFSFLLASDILSQSPDRFYNSWILHNSANIIKNILFAIGLWKVRLVKV